MELLSIALVLVIGLVLPLRALLVLFGIALPVDVLAGVEPANLDVLRYGLAILIVLRAPRAERSRRVRWVLIGAALLLLVGMVALVRTASDGGDYTRHAIAIVSVIAAAAVAGGKGVVRPILIGFTVGMTASAADIILQAAGLPYIGMTSDYGNRFSGLSFNSTTVAPFLAVAICILLSGAFSRHDGKRVVASSIARLLVAGLLMYGLLLSGGRGGVAGLLVALAVAALWKFREHALLVLSAAAALGVVLFIRRDDIATYLLRDRGDFGFFSGRDVLNGAAWETFMRGGLLGVSGAERAGLNPHTPLLTLAVDAGVFGLAAAALLIGMTAALVVRPSREFGLEYRMIAAVVLLASLLEPTGFFVGLSKVTVFMLLLAAWDETRGADAPSTVTPARYPRARAAPRSG